MYINIMLEHQDSCTIIALQPYTMLHN